MKKIIVLISVGFLLFSCGSTKKSGYKKLTQEEKQTIVPLTSFDQTEKGNIYTINATQLKEELQNHPKAMVCFYSNSCTDNECCRPMEENIKYASENDYKLFLVMKNYDNLSENFEKQGDNPVFSIDNEYYKRKKELLYTRYFINDLLYRELSSVGSECSNLFFYKNGNLTLFSRELPTDNQIIMK